MTIFQVLPKHFDAALSLYVGGRLPIKLPICRQTVAAPVAFFYPFSEDIKLDLSEHTSPLLWTPEAVNRTVGDFL